MIEKALVGTHRYWTLVILLLALSTIAPLLFWYQLSEGLGVTAMSRQMPWGFYIAQLTFLVGVAASAVVVVLPYYLYNSREFGRLVILGEFLAVPAVILSMLFVVVDVGQPARLANLFLHPSPRSMLFWDTVALSGYLILNMVVGWSCLEAERIGEKPSRWVVFLALLSIPWAISIHTITAFLFCGLAARPFWFTAILAPRFLASAFAAGPALLLLLCLLVRRITDFDPGQRAIRVLSHVVAWAMALNLFLFGVEIFTSVYSATEHHLAPLRHLYLPSPTVTASIVPVMWLGLSLGVGAMLLLAIPRTRRRTITLALACGLVFVSIWIDKGAGLLTGGMNPDPLGLTVQYFPSWVEIAMGLSLYAFGALILTLLYRIAIVTKIQAELR